MKKFYFNTITTHGMIEQDGIAYGYNDNNITSNMDTHCHDYYEMTYMNAGEAVQIINDKPYYVSKGSLIILSPKDCHSHHSLSKINPVNCNFQNTNMLSYIPDPAVFPIVIDLEPYFQQQIEHLLYLLMNEIDHHKPQHAKAAWNFLDSIFLLVSRNLNNTQRDLSASLENVLTYTIDHLRDVTFTDAVNVCGTSKGNFCRIFKKNFGKTFREFLVDLRIEQAKKLLLNTTHTLETIYKDCGYNNSRPFFLDFRKKCGMTPQQFRKLGRSALEEEKSTRTTFTPNT